MDKTAIPNNGKACGFHSEALHVPNLVARKKELAILEHHLELAAEGIGTTVFVSGEAGAGKTRLVTEFLNIAQRREIRVLKGWCLSNVAVPYFPFFEAFSVYFSSDQNKDTINLKNWLEGPHKETSKKTQMFTPQAWKDQTFLAVIKTLSVLSAKKPTLLFIDDIHWADSASLALINYISRVIKSKRILIVATFRSEELKVDSEGRSNSLVETLRLMRREDLFTEIKITSLSHENIYELARNMLGGELQQELSQKLTKESQGNPLFVVESLKMMRERNALIQENNRWKLTNTQLEMPSKIKDIILQRLECLDRKQRKVVEVASVVGEEFDPELLALALDSDLDEIITALDVINQTTTLVDYKDESYWFDHARTRDSIYEEISPALKRLYHKKIAQALIKNSEKSSLPFSELAYHYNKTGDKENAIKYSLAAGQDALAKWSNTEAIKQFSRILDIIREDPKHIAEFALALEGLGDAYYANSMVKDAAGIFLELSNKTTDDVVRLRALRKAMESVFQYGDMPYLMELVKKAELISSADRLEYARVLMSKARSYQMQGIYSGPFEPLRNALQIFEEEYSLWDIAWVLIGAGPQRAFFAKTDFEEKQGLAESLRAIALFEELGDLRWQMEAYYVAGLTFSYCLLENQALKLLAKGAEIGEENKLGNYLSTVYNLAASARTLLYMGNLKESLAINQKALKFLEKTDSGGAQGMVYSNLTMVYALLKDDKNSEKYFNELVKLTPEILAHVLIQIALTEAVFLAAKKQWEKAEQLFKKRFEIFENQKMPTAPGFLLRIKQLYAWVLENQGRSKEANILLEETKKTFGQVEERYAHASLQAQFMVRREIEVGEEVEMRLDIVNVGKQSSQILGIEDLFSSEDFKVTTLPEQCDFSKNNLDIDRKEIGVFQVETIKLKVQATRPGVFYISPLLVYIDDLGETKKCKVNQATLTVHKAQPQFEVLPGRITTGYMELDRLLMGGIPEKTAVVLTGSPSDERAYLINNFLEAGIEDDEHVFHITTEADNTDSFLENPNFHLFLCNPKPKVEVPDLSNVTKLRSKTDINNLNMALARESRGLQQEGTPKRLCIEIVSDVLLRLGPEVTRRWLSELITDLCSKGFTILAVLDSSMHPADQANAVINSFDGEISITQSEDPQECKKSIQVRKLRGQDYIKNPICLTMYSAKKELSSSWWSLTEKDKEKS